MKDGIGRTFLERTKHHHLTRSDQMVGVRQPPLELPYDPKQPTVVLPQPSTCPVRTVSVDQAIQQRRSVRQYADTPLSQAELSYLLWSTQGVREVMEGHATFRTVPSAGARHAFETYILANRIEGLTSGLYRYAALEHKLIETDLSPAIADQITAGCFGQGFVRTSAATFIWAAVPYRMTWRYGERGYRYLHLDAGHVCQNLYLSAEAIDCGVCAIAAFDDDHMNELLELDGESAFTIYVATVGKKRS
jgi:SagB-type dehydrogenase family enzyme